MSNDHIEPLGEKRLEHMAALFKALSNPNRLKLYAMLLPCLPPGTVCVADADEVESCQRKLSEHIGLAPSTVSHHLKELKNAGLIHMKRQGKQVSIEVDARMYALVRGILESEKI
jgi:ArsR family transcriptional regulator, arsenate/arsenite/antimonite-responsive transcriptional repressor